MSKLPGILADVEELAGVAIALRLARELGGTEINLSDADGSLLVRAIGKENARALVKRRQRGERVVVPMATARGQKGRRANAAAMAAAKATTRQIALACDMHMRTAKRVKKAVKQGARLDLFDGQG